VCILGSSLFKNRFDEGIHIWIQSTDANNANLMILLGYIIIEHPAWRKGRIKIFSLAKESEKDQVEQKLRQLIETGRLSISPKNIEIIPKLEDVSSKSIINKKSKDAGLTIIGFRSEQLKHDGQELFMGYDDLGNVLFVNALGSKLIM
jgi:DNA-binding TFAR19-related protein (PDSD5 family)